MSEVTSKKVKISSASSGAIGVPALESQLIALARETCVEVMSANDASHDYSHAFRVAATAHELAVSEAAAENDSTTESRGNIDILVIQLAALLHDVPDHKYAASAEAAQQKLEGVLDVLKEAGLSHERASKIRTVIGNVSFSKEKKQQDAATKEAEGAIGESCCSTSEETKVNTSTAVTDFAPLEAVARELSVVQDADRLDAIGAIGIARTFTFGGARKRPLYNPDKPLSTTTVLLSGEEYAAISADNKNATYDHFFEKLLHLKGMMKTSSGRRRAEDRHSFMLTYLDQLRGEIEGSK